MAPPLVEIDPIGGWPRKDPCWKLNRMAGGYESLLGDIYYTSITDLKKCLLGLKITNYKALWTLHNLHFGIAEAYSFTDIATEQGRSSRVALCTRSARRES